MRLPTPPTVYSSLAVAALLCIALAGFEAPQAIEAVVTGPAATFREDGAFMALGVDGRGGRPLHAAFREGYAVLLAAWFAPTGINVIWGRVLGALSALAAVFILSVVLKRIGSDPSGSRFSLLLTALSLPLLLAAATIHPAALGLLLVCAALHLHLRWRDTQESMWIFVAHGFLATGAVIHPAGLLMGMAAIAALWFGSHDRVARDMPVVFALPWLAAAGAGALSVLGYRGSYAKLVNDWLDGLTNVPAGGFLRNILDLIAAGRWFDVALTAVAVATAITGVVHCAKTRGSRRVVSVYAAGGVATFLLAAPGIRDPLGVWLLPALALATIPAVATPRVRVDKLAWCALVPLLLAVIGVVHVVHTVVNDPRHGAWENEVLRAVAEVPGIRKRTACVAPEVQWALGFDRRVIRARDSDPAPEFLIHRLAEFPPGTVSLGGTAYEVLRDGREYRVHRIAR